MKLCVNSRAALPYVILLMLAIAAPAWPQATKPATQSFAFKDAPDFSGMVVGMAEPDFQIMVADRGLRHVETHDGSQTTYQIYRRDGENLVAVFSAATCRSVARHPTDASYAKRLFGGLEAAAKAIQLTARVDKTTWKTGEALWLKADLRNKGDIDVAMYVGGYDLWEIGVDDVWYRSNTGSTAHAMMIAPGDRIKDISVPPTWTAPSDSWQAILEDDAPFAEGDHLKLEPGKHIIRIRTAPIMDRGEEHLLNMKSNSGDKNLRIVMGGIADDGKPQWIVSNSIEITVIEPEKPIP